jgi:hypothetical protein
VVCVIRSRNFWHVRSLDRGIGKGFDQSPAALKKDMRLASHSRRACARPLRHGRKRQGDVLLAPDLRLSRCTVRYSRNLSGGLISGEAKSGILRVRR